jgi:hypothetical protein
MLILLLPLTTICVALVGFYVWHRQLIRKRLFEVAEAGLSAFSMLRWPSPMHVGRSMKLERGLLGSEQRMSHRRKAICWTGCTFPWNALGITTKLSEIWNAQHSTSRCTSGTKWRGTFANRSRLTIASL